jgi:hypothetical protein
MDLCVLALAQSCPLVSLKQALTFKVLVDGSWSGKRVMGKPVRIKA